MLGFKLRQHVVEFLPGIGMVTDGATDATSLNGPWTWTVPEGFLGKPTIDACAGGSGGCGGGSIASGQISAGGGAGGAVHAFLNYNAMSFLPGEQITVTCGAAGLGAAAGTGTSPGVKGQSGGATSVVAPNGIGGDLTRYLFCGTPGYYDLGAGGGQTSSTGAANGGAGMSDGMNSPGGNNSQNWNTPYGYVYVAAGCNGGSGGSSGTVNGNGGNTGIGGVGNQEGWSGFSGAGGGSGTNSGGVSMGGGGAGQSGPFGSGGYGGGPNNPTMTGGNATGWGASAGGGAGGYAGGNGVPGMVRITFWSVE